MKSSYLAKQIGNICLLVTSDEGYYNLMKIVSFANQDGLTDKPKVDLNVLKQYHEGLIIFSGGIESWIGKMISAGEPEERILEVYEMLQGVFGKDCYFEITAQDEKIITELSRINQLILHLARKTDTACIVNNNYFYPEPKDKAAREMALSIKDNTKMYDAHRRQPEGKYHIMLEEEIKKICLDNGYKEEQIDERLANNEKIADQIQMKIKLGQALFPVYQAPDFVQELYEKYGNEMIEGKK